MDKRRVWLAGMWVVAIGAIAAIYLTLEPEPADSRTRTGGDAPTFGVTDRAPAGSRASLAVEEDNPSPRFYRGGRRHTGRSSFVGPAHAARAWRVALQGRVSAQPVVADDGTIYVGAHDHLLHAISPEGQPLWTADLHHRVWSAATVADDGAILVGSDADAFFSLDKTNGATRWRIRAEGDADGAASIAPDGTIELTAGNHLYAIAPDGTVRWRFEARGPFLLSTPAIDSDGTAYVGSLDDHVYAVAADGRMRWDYATENDVSSSPVIGDDGTIYFGSDDEHVHAISRDGARRWRTDVDGYVRAPVALGRRGDVLAAVYGPRPRVVSLDAHDGTERWSFPVTVSSTSEVGVASGPLVDADGNIYFGAHDDFVYSLDADGALRWIHQTGGDIDSSPILTPQGLLLVGSDDGYLYAIRDAAPSSESDAGAADAGSPETAPQAPTAIPPAPAPASAPAP